MKNKRSYLALFSTMILVSPSIVNPLGAYASTLDSVSVTNQKQIDDKDITTEASSSKESSTESSITKPSFDEENQETSTETTTESSTSESTILNEEVDQVEKTQKLPVEDESTIESQNSVTPTEAGVLGTSSWQIDSDGTLHIGAGDLTANGATWSGDSPWSKNASQISKIIFDGKVTTNVAASLFNNLSIVTEISGLEQLDISQATSTNLMFGHMLSLQTLDLSHLDTSNVTDMSEMFSFCGVSNIDVSSFNTSNVTDMSSMFSDTSHLTSLDLSNFNTSNVASMEYMFSDTVSLSSLNLSGFDTSNVTDMKGMFAFATNLASLDLSDFNTAKVTNVSNMFYYMSKLLEIDISNFDSTNIADMSNMFREDSSLEKLILGIKFKFIGGSASLTQPVAVGGTGTGKWIKEDHSSIGYLPEDFMNKYGTGDLTPGTYVAELVREVEVNVHDSNIYVGDTWKAEDNFDSALDKDGNKVDFSQLTVDDSKVDSSKAGVYEVTYTYDGVTSTAKVTVKDKQTSVNVHDSNIYVGDTWKAEDNFDSALDKDGNKVDFSQLTVDDSKVDLSKAGVYEVTYTYDGVTSTAKVTVVEDDKGNGSKDENNDQNESTNESKGGTTSEVTSTQDVNIDKSELPQTAAKETPIWMSLFGGLTMISSLGIFLGRKKSKKQ